MEACQSNLFSGVGKDLGASTNWMDWVQNSVYTQNNHTVSLTQANKKKEACVPHLV